ncbi:MAG TPA: hypothetical protein VFX30_07030 [bacterium]|nr:hypothetical protein [bacterium]
MKRLTLLVVTALAGAVSVSAGCGNGSLLASNPSVSADPGTVSAAATHHLSDDSELEADVDGFKTLVTDQGFTITIEEARLGWKELVLISGGEDPECVEGHDQTIALNKGEDLLAEDIVASELIDATVPMIAYCGYQIVFGPSTAASALIVDRSKSHEAGGEAEGTAVSEGADGSLHLSGTWSKGGDSGAFDIRSTSGAVVEGTFQSEEDGEVIDHPLHFHEGETSVGVAFGTNYDVLFSGIDFQHDSEDAQAGKAVSNLVTAVHQDSVSHDN